MSKVEIPLSGWQQTPEERGGQPRIARLTNAMLDNQGRILKSPGQFAVPLAIASGYATFDAVSVAGNHLMINDRTSDPYYTLPGYRPARFDGAKWVYDYEPHAFLPREEAPRLTRLFCEAGSHYVNQGVMDLGEDGVVVYAEKLTDWQPGTGGDDVGSFASSVISWTLLSGLNGLKEEKTGEITVFTGVTALDYRNISYPSVSGRYLCCWNDTGAGRFLYIYLWNAVNKTFDLIDTVAVSAVTSNSAQIDVWHSAEAGVLLILRPDGVLLHYRLSTGAETLLTTGTPYQGGTCGLGVIPDWGTGVQMAAVVVQTTTTRYVVYPVQITATGGTVGTPETLLDSPELISNGSDDYWIKRPEICWDATNETLFALLPYRAIDPTIDACECEAYTLRFTYAPNSTTVTIGPTPGIAYHRYCTSKPLFRSGFGFTWWSTDTINTTLRTASLSGTGVVTGDVIQDRTLALIGGDPGVSPAERYVGGGGPIVWSDRLPPIRYAVSKTSAPSTEYRSGWVGAIAVQRSPLRQATDIYLATVACGAAIGYSTSNSENPADVGQSATVKGVTYVASGNPLAITARPDSAGFSRQPPPVVWTYSATGTAVSGEVRRVVTCLKYTNKAGEIVLGPVSDPQTYTFGADGSVAVSCYFWGAAPSGWMASLMVYQSINGVYHLLNGPGGDAYPSLSGLLTYSDAAAPAAIGSEPIIYTQGANGAISGQLDHFGCPPCRTIWAGRNRIICGGLWDERRVQFSNLFFPTEAVSWPASAAFYATVEEPVTAVASSDDYWFVFSHDNIWVIAGAGPDNMGIGSFEAPLKVSTGLGCPSWRSVVDTPMGLMFQGTTGQIYLIPKGSVAPTVISQAIRDSVAQYSDSDPSYPSVWIKGAVFDPLTNEVRFVCYNSDWVLQLGTLAWRRDTVASGGTNSPYNASFCGTLAIPVQDYSGPVIGRYNNVGTSFLTRIKRRSDVNHYTDSLLGARTMSIETNDIDLGRGRIRRGWVRVARDVNGSTSTTIPYSVAVWFDGADHGSAADETLASPGLEAPSGRFVDLEYCTARQKCNQVRVRISDNCTAVPNSADHILGVWLDLVVSKESPIKTTAGNGRMT